MKYPPPIPGLLIGALIVAIICAVECWAFVLMYRNVVKSPEGRHLFRLSILLGLVFTLTVVFQFLPANMSVVFIAAVVQLVIFIAVAAELWVRITLLRENQRKYKALSQADEDSGRAHREDHEAELANEVTAPNVDVETGTS